MIFTDRLTKALDTAAILHKDHRRIGHNKIPYITHLIHVLATVSRYTDNEDTLIAALMHDTVEDVDDYTLEKLREDFGEDVRNLVESLTEERVFDKNLSPRERWIQAKKGYIEKLHTAPKQAKLISAADKIHNMSTILLGYEQEDEVLMLRFDETALKGQIWFTREVLSVIQDDIPKDLSDLYKEQHKKLEDLMN